MVAFIASNVLGELLLPEYLIAGRCCSVAAASMPVPEASVNQHNRFPLWQNDIGTAGKATVMQSITEPGCMQRLANDDFRFGIAAPDAGHNS